MSLGIVALILVAVAALIAIPVIAAVAGRSMADEDPNDTGDPEHDRNVESRDAESREENSPEEGRRERR